MTVTTLEVLKALFTPAGGSVEVPDEMLQRAAAVIGDAQPLHAQFAGTASNSKVRESG